MITFDEILDNAENGLSLSDEQLGSWLSSAFRRVTGVRLSSVVAPIAAVAGYAVGGPSVAQAAGMLAGAVSNGGGDQGMSLAQATANAQRIAAVNASAAAAVPAPQTFVQSGPSVDPFVYDQVSKETAAAKQVPWGTVAAVGVAALVGGAIIAKAVRK